MITKSDIKKAAAMYDSRLTWEAIGDTLGLDAAVLRAACEKVAGRPLPDRAPKPAAPGSEPRRIGTYTIGKRECPAFQRFTPLRQLAASVHPGDCIVGVKTNSFATSFRKLLAPRSLTCRGVKHPDAKLWDIYILPIKKA